MKLLTANRSSLLVACLALCAMAPLAPAFQKQTLLPARPLEAAPVGSILAWHVDLMGTPPLPSSWQMCDGQMVTDPASPYFGQTLPDLNGEGRYLRGGVFSGVLQDDATATNGLSVSIATAGSHTHSMGSAGAHSHTRTNVGGIGGTRGFASAGSQSGVTGTSTAGNHTHSIGSAGNHSHTTMLDGDTETRPVTMSVVWILRIK